jgi:hypothetical protein
MAGIGGRLKRAIAVIAAIRRTECYGTTGSLRLDPGELNHLAPLLGFVGDELAEVRR